MPGQRWAKITGCHHTTPQAVSIHTHILRPHTYITYVHTTRTRKYRHSSAVGTTQAQASVAAPAAHVFLLYTDYYWHSLLGGPSRTRLASRKRRLIACGEGSRGEGREGGRRDSVGEALPCVACLPHQSSLFGLHLPLTRVARQTHAFCTRQFAVPAALPFLLPSPNWRGFITSDKLFHHTTSIASFQPSAISIYDAVRVLFARILTLRPLRRNTHSSKTQTSIQP